MTFKRIAIHGVPRSGTTWIGALFDSCPVVRYVSQPLFSYAFKDRLNLQSNRSDIVNFFAEITDSRDDFINQTLPKSTGAVPRFEKQKRQATVYKEARYHHLLPHLLATDDELIAFLIIRNPLSVLASWRKAPKEFNSQTMNFLDEWRTAHTKNGGRIEEFYGYEKWKQFASVAHQLQEQYPDRCRVIRYRQILENTTAELQQCFAFCGLPWHLQTETFIDQCLRVAEPTAKETDSPTTDPYAVFRVNQTDDKWKTELPESIIRTVTDELADTELAIHLN